MKKILRVLLPLVLCIEVTNIVGQQIHIEYGYNRNGDRITRKVITIPANRIKSAELPTEAVVNPVVTDYFANREIRIYPNPTKGSIRVDVLWSAQASETHNESQSIDVFLYDRSGKQLFQSQFVGSVIYLDFSDYPAGWYILQLRVGKSNKEYKIIKE